MHWRYIYNDGVYLSLSVTKKWPSLLYMEKSLSLRAERRRREARRETFTTPKMVTTRRSILGPPAEGRPGPSDDDDDDDDNDYWCLCPTMFWSSFWQIYSSKTNINTKNTAGGSPAIKKRSQKVTKRAKRAHLLSEKVRKSRQIRFHDKTAYV